jgi:hypothetical protein
MHHEEKKTTVSAPNPLCPLGERETNKSGAAQQVSVGAQGVNFTGCQLGVSFKQTRVVGIIIKHLVRTIVL